MSLDLKAPLSLTIMRWGIGFGAGLVGVTVLVLVTWFYAAWIHDLALTGGARLQLDSSRAFVPVAVERPDGYGCQVQLWAQTVGQR